VIRTALTGCALLLAACGSDRSDGPAERPPPLTERATPGSNSTAEPSNTRNTSIMIGGSGASSRSSAWARGSASNGARSGGGAASRDRQTVARCKRLVARVVALTGQRVPASSRGKTRTRLAAQSNELRDACASVGALSSEYETCVLRAKTLEDALLCNPTGSGRDTGAFARAKELSTRKDLLDKAERNFAKGGPRAPDPAIKR